MQSWRGGAAPELGHGHGFAVALVAFTKAIGIQPFIIGLGCLLHQCDEGADVHALLHGPQIALAQQIAFAGTLPCIWVEDLVS